MTSSHIVSPAVPLSNTTSTPVFSWEAKNRDELIAWLVASAQRLDTRAQRAHFDRAERDRLLRMATADWYSGRAGGAR